MIQYVASMQRYLKAVRGRRQMRVEDGETLLTLGVDALPKHPNLGRNFPRELSLLEDVSECESCQPLIYVEAGHQPRMYPGLDDRTAAALHSHHQIIGPGGLHAC